jgi:hypothetical protein
MNQLSDALARSDTITQAPDVSNNWTDEVSDACSRSEQCFGPSIAEEPSFVVSHGGGLGIYLPNVA